MKQTLEQLIKLQEIDQRLLEIKEHMGDLPVTVKTQEIEVASVQSENEQKQSRIGRNSCRPLSRRLSSNPVFSVAIKGSSEQRSDRNERL